ncbi:hypothetical protein DFH28DRAFT_227328, partial [Melampsora americana]
HIASFIQQVIIAFHSFLQAALAQAHLERLLDPSILTSAQDDIQIIGPSICLFLAALRTQTQPPSICTTSIKLDQNNCPSSFKKWFTLWSESIPVIKSLSKDHQHDLARIICDQDPISQPINIQLPIIARNLRAIAIEISQRRTFQERFNQDLNFALQHGSQTNKPLSAKYVPPPAYDDQGELYMNKPNLKTNLPSSSPPLPSRARQPSSMPIHSNPNEEELSPDQQFTLSIIRETIYASLTDILYSTPTIYKKLESEESSDGELSRSYFASLCLALLDVSINRIDTEKETVEVVKLNSSQLFTKLKLSDCPNRLKPLMFELIRIGRLTQDLMNEDTRLAIMKASGDSSDENGNELTKIEQLKLELELGTYEIEPESDVRIASNAINSLGLKISQIEAFRKREAQLFEILVPTLAIRNHS